MTEVTARRTCQRCGATFTRKPTGPEPRYCGQECKRAEQRQRNRERGQYADLLATRKARTAASCPPCINCGLATPSKVSRYCKAPGCRAVYQQERNARNAAYHRENYVGLYAKATMRRLNPRALYTCTICNEKYERSPAWMRTRYCSLACIRAKQAADRKDPAKRKARAAFRRIPLASSERWAECRNCGETFRKDSPGQLYCNHSCATAASFHRRAKRERAAWVEHVDRLTVFIRDEWRCHLCGGHLQRGARVPHPLAPTIDHVVPLARGGEHSMANVSAAHFTCNTRKGNRLDAM
jgi:hypothetical protein